MPKYLERETQRGNIINKSADKMRRIRNYETVEELLLQLQQMRDKRLLRLRAQSPISTRALSMSSRSVIRLPCKMRRRTRARPGSVL